VAGQQVADKNEDQTCSVHPVGVGL
jgi:hypothetical protein